MRNMTHALIRGLCFLKVKLAHVICKINLPPALLAKPHPSQRLRNIDPVLRSETIFMMNKMHYPHRVSNLDPSFRSYTTVDFQNHPYIASLPLESPWTLLGLHHLSSFLELQPNPFLHHQGFTTLLKNSVPLKNERRMIPLRPKISSEISSMKLVLQANYTVRFTNQTSWINALTELLIALALVAFLCTYRYGTTGHVGAPVTRILLLTYRYPWYSIIYMLQTT